MKCPDIRKLEELLNGRLSPEEYGNIEAHVETCVPCQELLETLTDRCALNLPIPPLAAGNRPAPVAPGTCISDNTRLEIRRHIASGGQGDVYEAWQADLGRVVAIKMLPGTGSATALAAFKTEAASHARLTHPHIVPIYGYGEHDRQPYFVMEFMPGGTLAERVHPTRAPISDQSAVVAASANGDAPGTARPLPVAEAAQIVETLARAIHYAHGRGIVHRDLKPANVLLAEDGTPKVADFGLAWLTDGPPGSRRTLGTRAGSLPYMAPEQISGQAGQIGPHTDVYALGAILNELLTGRPPFQAHAGSATCQQQGQQGPTLRPGLDQVPRGLRRICLKCLATDPAQRYASAAVLADELRRYLADEPLFNTVPVGPLTRLWYWCRRKPALAVATGLTASALAAVAAVSMGWAVRERVHAAELGEALGRAKYQLAENYLYRGVALCERGDVSVGLLFLARSLEKAPAGADDLRTALRSQIAGWSAQLRPLTARIDNSGLLVAASLSPDGRTVWLVGQDKTLSRWSAETGHCLGPPVPLPTQTRALCCAPDGATVLTLTSDGAIACWEAAGPRHGVVPTERVRAAVWGADGAALVIAGMDGRVRLWDATQGNYQGSGFRQEGVVAVAVGPDGHTTLTLTDQGTAVDLWNVVTGEHVGGPISLSRPATALALCPDGRTVVTAGDDRLTQVWDIATGQRRGLPLRHKGTVEALAVSPDGCTFLAGVQDGTARLLDTATGQPVGPPLQHSAPVRSVGFGRDGRTILTASLDGTVRLWSVAADRLPCRALPHQSKVQTAVFSPNGQTMLTAGWDKKVRLWNVAGNKEPVELEHPQPLTTAGFSPDGRQLVTVCWDQTVRLWKAETGALLRELPHLAARVSQALFSPDGRTVLTGANDGGVRFWKADTEEPRGAIGHQGRVTAAAFSPDGQTAFTGGEDSNVRFWNVATGQPFGPVLSHKDAVLDLAVSPDGTMLLTASRDHRVRLWDLSTGGLRFPEGWHGGPVVAVAFSPDGQTVLTGSWDRFARLWSTQTGQPVGSALEHDDRVVSVAFSPGGRVALTASRDGTARRWHAATGIALGPPLAHKDRIRSAAFSPDGRAVLTAGDEGAARLWYDLEPECRVPDDQLVPWLEAATGLTLDSNDVIGVLDTAAWNERRSRIGKRDGSPP